MNGWPSSKVFAPSREKLNCPDDCETCKLTLKTNCCFTKHVVYQIMCSNCNITYIGKTGRTVGSRIKEHLKMKKQTVFVHLKSHSDQGRRSWGDGGDTSPPIFGLGGRISNCPPHFFICLMKFNSTLFSVYCRHCLSPSILLNIVAAFSNSITHAYTILFFFQFPGMLLIDY